MSGTKYELNQSCCYYDVCYGYYEDNAALLASWMEAEQTCY